MKRAEDNSRAPKADSKYKKKRNNWLLKKQQETSYFKPGKYSTLMHMSMYSKVRNLAPAPTRKKLQKQWLELVGNEKNTDVEHSFEV